MTFPDGVLNEFVVSLRTHDSAVAVLKPPRVAITPEKAVELAAWLLVIASIKPGMLERFCGAVEAVSEGGLVLREFEWVPEDHLCSECNRLTRCPVQSAEKEGPNDPT